MDAANVDPATDLGDVLNSFLAASPSEDGDRQEEEPAVSTDATHCPVVPHTLALGGQCAKSPKTSSTEKTPHARTATTTRAAPAASTFTFMVVIVSPDSDFTGSPLLQAWSGPARTFARLVL